MGSQTFPVAEIIFFPFKNCDLCLLDVLWAALSVTKSSFYGNVETWKPRIGSLSVPLPKAFPCAPQWQPQAILTRSPACILSSLHPLQPASSPACVLSSHPPHPQPSVGAPSLCPNCSHSPFFRGETSKTQLSAATTLRSNC